MTPFDPRCCHWCHVSRAEYYTFVGHHLVCSDRCPARPRGITYHLLRLVDPYRGQGTIYYSPEEYEDALDEAADAILTEHHPHLFRAPAPPKAHDTPAFRESDLRAGAGGRTTHGMTTYGARGSRASTQINDDPTRPAPLADVDLITYADGQIQKPAPPPVTGIVKTSDYCDGAARIEGTNVAVWMVADAQASGASYEEMERYWTLTADQIERALTYWDQNPVEIDRDLQQHAGRP